VNLEKKIRLNYVRWQRGAGNLRGKLGASSCQKTGCPQIGMVLPAEKNSVASGAVNKCRPSEGGRSAISVKERSRGNIYRARLCGKRPKMGFRKNG